MYIPWLKKRDRRNCWFCQSKLIQSLYDVTRERLLSSDHGMVKGGVFLSVIYFIGCLVVFLYEVLSLDERVCFG